MSESTYILGISESHNATAALVKDGKLIAAASEERFSRRKTHKGFPKRAIKYVLKEAGISPKELDLVVSSFQNNAMYALYESDEPSNKGIEPSGNLLGNLIVGLSPLFNEFSYLIPPLRKLRSNIFEFQYFITQAIMQKPRVEYIQKRLGVPKEKIFFALHHDCHVYGSYALRTTTHQGPYLVITLDGEGDKYCATVGVYKNGKYTRISSTPNFRSIGRLYLDMTTYLGMKPNEHEYKVMGMAPYSETKRAEKVHAILKPLIWTDDNLVFHSQMDDRLFYFFIKENLEKYRFDYLSAGVQLFTEELIVDWVKKAIRKTHIKNLILGGGVFMNVKVNKLIAEIPEVKSISICPSSGDESTAIGAAFYGYELVKNGTTNLSLPIEPVGPLYLGPTFTEQDFKNILKKPKWKNQFELIPCRNIPKKIARLLASGEIVALMQGRMEFGARALGNRSILANPQNRDIVDILNQKIKSRDFWMPFASSLLKEAEKDYIKNPKNISGPYMILAFDTTPQAKKDIFAAMHPSDLTTRPQIVEKSWNETYWTIINEFRKLTGIGGVLNTSFNLHGEPIVHTPEDALHTMKESDLNWLATETLLIKKKS